MNTLFQRIVWVGIVCFGFVSLAASQSTTLWERAAGRGSLPSWFSPNGHTERGFAYGRVGTNDRLYVVSRNGGTFVRILNASTGADVDTLRVAGISGGTFALNDIEVSSDGIIYACNLTTSTGASPFKVYRWTSESASPATVISYGTGTLRLGDKITVVGSASDNSLVIYAAAATKDTVVKFTTTDNGASFTPTIIKLSDGNMGSSPSVAPFGTGNVGFFINSIGQSAKEYDANGTFKAAVPGTVIATASNAIRYIARGNSKFVVTYQYGAGNENLRLVDVTVATDSAKTVVISPSLGTNANPNGTGDVAVKVNPTGTADLFILSTNNGIGAYRTDFVSSVEWLADFGVPSTFVLEQNFPNPFNPTTTIRYHVPQSGRLSLKVFDMLGRELRTLVDGNVEAGSYQATWDGRNEAGDDLPSGIYFYQLSSQGLQWTKKMTLVK